MFELLFECPEAIRDIESLKEASDEKEKLLILERKVKEYDSKISEINKDIKQHGLSDKTITILFGIITFVALAFAAMGSGGGGLFALSIRFYGATAVGSLIAQLFRLIRFVSEKYESEEDAEKRKKAKKLSAPILKSIAESRKALRHLEVDVREKDPSKTTKERDQISKLYGELDKLTAMAEKQRDRDHSGGILG